MDRMDTMDHGEEKEEEGKKKKRKTNKEQGGNPLYEPAPSPAIISAADRRRQGNPTPGLRFFPFSFFLLRSHP